MLLNFFTKRQKPFKDDILNFGLRLLLKSPFEFNLDIKDNLLHKYSGVTEEQAVNYEEICNRAKQAGQGIIYETMVKRLKASDPMTTRELRDFYTQEFKSKFHWVNEKNIQSIYNIASYSLMHDGWNEFKK